MRNVWCSSCLKAWRWRENTARERGAVNVKCSWCRRKDTVEGVSEEDRKRILWEEIAIVELESSGVPCTGRSTTV